MTRKNSRFDDKELPVPEGPEGNVPNLVEILDLDLEGEKGGNLL